MSIIIRRNNSIDAEHDIILPRSASYIWGQMRDWKWFMTRDPLHYQIDITNWGRREMMIDHRFLGISIKRRARLLRWNEGSGFAFSDLSKRGNDCGFPHVCEYTLHPIDDHSCRLTIAARGKWTANWVPLFARKLWLTWILGETARHIHHAMKSFIMFDKHAKTVEA